ncbi:DUF2306 domain-containing protein [Belliella sp. DSM 111904]|uniref:DUF2306 domain-containing protein n=1 Tax=Belliella filtrata TaxID=2923435 RepID=A0ABS9UUS7_9BACT|nr:DUF2306 domain-containing protein [Belliella filtrata]MCH7407901.1 DUF2306 domain-containing protein [Belliella filtrata]
MYDFVNTCLGWFHFSSALMAMLAGWFVLSKPKGTKLHKRAGYFYVIFMVLVCGSAFFIYNLTGKFGVFHILAIVGFVTLLAGMIPIWIKIIQKKYQVFHLWFMYYSVLGLYAAFASELIVRIPDRPFYTMVAIATGLIFFLGSLFIFWKEKKWSNYFL